MQVNAENVYWMKIITIFAVASYINACAENFSLSGVEVHSCVFVCTYDTMIPQVGE